MGFDPKRLSRRERAGGLSPWLGDEPLFVREMSALEGVDMVERWDRVKDDAPARVRELARAVSLLAVDAGGAAVFADEEAVLSCPVAFLEAVFAAAMAFNRLSDGDQEAARKNSEAARSDASPNGCASPAAAST
jgi:hypothetical protein